jgi:hypothetical protein
MNKWQGRQDLNLRMPGSKPGDLPLVDAPIPAFIHLLASFENQNSVEAIDRPKHRH